MKNKNGLRQDQIQKLWKGLEGYAARLERQKGLYLEVAAVADRVKSEAPIVRLQDSPLLRSALRDFGPALSGAEVNRKLSSLYDAAFDKASGALIIANRGATLWCLSPKSSTPYLTRHVGFSVYLPGLGIETVNAGLVGDVYQGNVACRSESACTPSFLFGSQRCNCCHQWDSFREAAALFNRAPSPALPGDKFEKWVQTQGVFEDGRFSFNSPGPGFIFVHLDSQNGMGSGASPGEFCADLFNRASLRHRGEYSAEQVLDVTMAGGFAAIGLEPDPRTLENNLGYRVAPIVLDYLGVSKNLLLLSNNKKKVSAFEERGYAVQRVKSIGAVNHAGALEAEQRGTEFGHLDIDGCCVPFEKELDRLTKELRQFFAVDERKAA